jgi:hypothetical protein
VPLYPIRTLTGRRLLTLERRKEQCVAQARLLATPGHLLAIELFVTQCREARECANEALDGRTQPVATLAPGEITTRPAILS